MPPAPVRSKTSRTTTTDVDAFPNRTKPLVDVEVIPDEARRQTRSLAVTGKTNLAPVAYDDYGSFYDKFLYGFATWIKKKPV